MSELKLSGKSDAKGKNGYFKLVRVETMHVPNDEQKIHIDFYSKRSNNNVGPMRLVLTAEDTRALLTFLIEDMALLASESGKAV